SSDILSRPVDVTRYGVIYAGAQKNLGPAGISIVIVRRELMGHAPASVPTMLDYAAHAAAGSMLNTPPTLAWYFTGLVLEWLKGEGGVPVMAERAREKAALLYDYIDRSSLFQNPVERAHRSLMNVVFSTGDTALDDRFV